MLTVHWLARIVHSFHGSSTARRRKRPVRMMPAEVQQLETRVLLSAVSFSDGQLIVSYNGTTDAEITISVDSQTGEVLVNGQPVSISGDEGSGGSPSGTLQAADVTAIVVQPVDLTDSTPRTIDLRGVTRLGFTNLESVYLRGAQGNDLVLGSEFDDIIVGAGGDDTLWGGDGDDTINGQGHSLDTLVGGPGNDRLIGSDREIDATFSWQPPGYVSPDSEWTTFPDIPPVEGVSEIGPDDSFPFDPPTFVPPDSEWTTFPDIPPVEGVSEIGPDDSFPFDPPTST